MMLCFLSLKSSHHSSMLTAIRVVSAVTAGLTEMAHMCSRKSRFQMCSWVIQSCFLTLAPLPLNKAAGRETSLLCPPVAIPCPLPPFAPNWSHLDSVTHKELSRQFLNTKTGFSFFNQQYIQFTHISRS